MCVFALIHSEFISMLFFLIAHNLMRQTIKIGAFFLIESVEKICYPRFPNLLINKLCTKSIFVKFKFGTVKAFVHGSTVFNHHCMSPSKAM